jgi:hypothetical protein
VLARVHSGCPGQPRNVTRQLKSVHAFERGTAATSTSVACNAITVDAMKNDLAHGLSLCGRDTKTQAMRSTRFRVGPFAHYSLTQDRVEDTRIAIRQHRDDYALNRTLWSKACIHYAGRRNVSLTVAEGGVAPQAWGMTERSGACVDYDLILRIMLQIHGASERGGQLDTNLCQPAPRSRDVS